MIAMILAVPVFNWCGFNTQLPSLLVIVIFYIYKFLEQNQSLFSQLFLFENDLRFYHSAIWTGIISFASLWLSLWMGYGFIGVVFSQSIPLLVYVAWKWPLEAIKTYGISVGYDFVIHPFNQIKGIRYGKLF